MCLKDSNASGSRYGKRVILTGQSETRSFDALLTFSQSQRAQLDLAWQTGPMRRRPGGWSAHIFWLRFGLAGI